MKFLMMHKNDRKTEAGEMAPMDSSTRWGS